MPSWGVGGQRLAPRLGRLHSVHVGFGVLGVRNITQLFVGFSALGIQNPSLFYQNTRTANRSSIDVSPIPTRNIILSPLLPWRGK